MDDFYQLLPSKPLKELNDSRQWGHGTKGAQALMAKT